MKVRVNESLCQGHGRCYAVAPGIFEPDEIGNGLTVGDGVVAPEQSDLARLAAANCPELAITIDEETSNG